MADIREKIKKLLALGASTNEHEARAALLKARELMAKHKLSERDFEEATEQKLIHKECEVKWTTDSGNIWMVDLAKTICDQYCCSAAWRTPRGTRTHVLVVSGIGEDVDICKAVMEYATSFVLKQIKKQQRRWQVSDSKSVARSYADGFIVGLQMALEEQMEEHREWGLVLVKPQEVVDYEESLGTRSVNVRKAARDAMAYMAGEKDGREFDMHKHIG